MPCAWDAGRSLEAARPERRFGIRRTSLGQTNRQHKGYYDMLNWHVAVEDVRFLDIFRFRYEMILFLSTAFYLNG